MIKEFITRQNTEILEGVRERIRSLFPITNRGEIRLLKTYFKRIDSPFDYSLINEKKKKKETFGALLYGDFLIIQDGKQYLIKNSKICEIPLMTALGTFIYEGTEYMFPTQIRRRPAIYVVRRKGGDYEVQINSRIGFNYRITQSPEGIFYIETDLFKDRLYPILKLFNIPDEVIEEKWGKEILEVNKVPIEPYLRKFHKLIFKKEEPSIEIIKDELKKHFTTSEFESQINQLTIKLPKKNLDGEALLVSATKLLKVRKGEEEPDNPNNITFKSFHTPASLFIERLSIPQIRNEIHRRYKGRLHLEPKKVLLQKYIDRALKGLFLTDLAHVADFTNQLGTLAAISFTTPLGLGGISDPNLMPVEGRFVDDSHLGIIDPLFTPENEKVGLSLHLTPNIQVKHNEAYIPVYSTKLKKIIEVRASDLLNQNVAFPDEYDENFKPKRDKVKVRFQYTIKEVPSDEVDYVIPSTLDIFSIISWLVPLKNFNNPQRLTIGIKNFPYAIPLKDPDEPLVQAAEGKESIEKAIGHELAITAPEDGIVHKIEKDKIIIKTKDNKKIPVFLPVNLVLAEDSFLTTKKIYVKEGDRVSKGDLLADTNFTKGGVLAIGKNLKVGYIPFKGFTNKDAIVISESAAEKLTSEHIYRIVIPKTINSLFSKKHFLIYFPGIFSDEELKKLDDRGIIKKGEKVLPNTPLALRLEKRLPTPDEIMLGKIEKAILQNYQNRAEVWTKDVVGEVLDVIERDDEIEIQIKTEEKARVGDKLVGRYGNKGVISLILPDDQMPKDENGEPLDILLSPATVVTRLNPAQLIETVAGKLANKRKEKILLPHFGDFPLEKLLEKLKKEGLKEVETLDIEGIKTDKILTGYQYFYKMKQQAEKGYSVRIPETGYDFNLRPLTGAEGGAKALDLLTIYALLAHNSRAFLREAMTYKAEYFPEFWDAIQKGLPLPNPRPTFVFEKFKTLLAPLGLSLERNDNQLFILPMTDKEIMEKFPQALDPQKAMLTLKKKGFDLIPLKGGLYDPFIFGGLYGKKQAHLPLATHIPNPFFLSVILSLADINENQLRKLLRGESIDKFKNYEEFLNYFKNFPVDEEIKKLQKLLDEEKNMTLKNKYYRSLRFLIELQKENRDPFSVLFLSKIPVIPPIMRPVYLSEQGKLIESDLNTLYKRIALVNQKLFELKDLAPELREELFEAIADLQGVGQGVLSRQGIMRLFVGAGGKESYFQRLLLSKPQELSGRAVITMDPKLRLDEIGIPEDMAFQLYSPFIIAELKKMGINLDEAKKLLEERADITKKILEEEIKKRPIVVNRSPSLHKFSILAFYPKLVPGKTIKLHPLVTKGFNADFDGDAMQVFVPTTREAIQDAIKMLPSQNIIKPGPDTPIMLPEEDTILGLYLVSTKPEKKIEKNYNRIEDLKEDLEKKKITLISPIKFKGKEMRAGFALIYDELKPYNIEIKTPLSLDNIKHLMVEVLKKAPDKIKDIYDLIQKIGDEASIFMPSLAVSHLIQKGDIEEKLKNIAPVKIFLESQARGSKQHFKELLDDIGSRLDNWGNILPIKGSYGKGLSLGEWWKTLYQARSGIISRVVLIRKPGEIAKSMLLSTADQLIRSKGEDLGLEMEVDNPDIIGRFLMEDIKIDGKKINKMTIIDENLVRELKKAKINTIRVGSPLTGYPKAGTGIPYFSFGLNEKGQIIEPGTNIGIIASHAITEPLSQTTLNILKSPQTLGGLQKLETLFRLPEESDAYEIYSPIDGVIKDIRTYKGKQLIYVDSIVIEVPIFKKILKKKGDKVFAGEPLTEGLFNPRQYAQIKGIIETRKRLKDEIKKTLESEFGIPIRDRYIEVIVRAMTNYGRVLKSDKPDILPLDILPLTILEKENMTKEKTIDLTLEPEAALGTILNERVSGILPGVVIDEKVLDIIKKIKPKINVKVPEIRYEPYFKGFNLLPLLKDDIFVRASHGFVSKSLKDAVLLKTPANIHSQHPIPGLIYGAEFSIMDDEEEY